MYDVNATISIGSLSVKVIDSIYSYRLDGGVVFYAVALIGRIVPKPLQGEVVL